MSGIILILFIASIAACHTLARKQGKNPVFWVVMAAIFGPLAIPFIFIKTGDR